ncbi:unnamed protein product [Staurois parvus]|uniref:Antifreeze protein n=1 Tax=Staurois parvus TaxID=386267 RepID=A0ABN9DWS1_9NEOB|nr:unnamed protein product [Staurois parvus]
MPKHNSATLTCDSKTVHITTTLYIQVDYTLVCSGQIGLSFGGKCALSDTAVSVLVSKTGTQICSPTEKSPVP